MTTDRTEAQTNARRWKVYHADVEPALPARWRDVYPVEGLRQDGSQWRGPCPIHGGSNAEGFSVDPSTGTWCCFSGCDPGPGGSSTAGGGPLEFVSRREGISIELARDRLAAIVGVDLDRDELSQAEVDLMFGDWARARHLDPDRLAGPDWRLNPRLSWWVQDGAPVQRPCFEIPTPIGTPRLRFLDGREPKTAWITRKEQTQRGLAPGRAHLYGLEQALPLVADGGRLYFVNGEPSVWACWQSNLPAVCTAGGEKPLGRKELARLAGALDGHGITVAVVFDLDAAGRKGAPLAVAALRDAGLTAVALELPADLGAKGDVDDLHRRVGDDELAAALDGLGELTSIEEGKQEAVPGDGPGVGDAAGEDEGADADNRPEIIVSEELHRNVSEAIAALASHSPGVYQRGCELVRVVRERTRPEGERRDRDDVALPRRSSLPSGTPKIRPVARGTMPALLSAAARWRKYDGRHKCHIPALPPQDVCAAVLAEGEYPGIRPLAGVVDSPILRPDGTILDEPGYDEQTRLLYLPGGSFPAVLPTPSMEDAQRALAELLEVVAEFPFAGEVHRTAWLASVLTAFAVPAIDGPFPCFYMEASRRGSGKGLLAKAAGIIFGGRDPACYTWPTGSPGQVGEELRKALLGYAMIGARTVLIDNINGAFGDQPALEAVLTSRGMEARQLGANEVLTLPWDAVVYATGNNALIVGDMDRRVILCRLEPQTENPEERTFQRENLLGWVKRERPRLARAALTLLRAYFAAGAPRRSGVPPMADYPEWSAVVRHCLLWLGLPDVAATRKEIQGNSPETQELGALIAGWEELADGGAISVAEALARLAQGECADLKNTLGMMFGCRAGELPTPRVVGNRLRALRGRIIQGRRMVRSGESRDKSVKWRVERIGGSAGSAGSAGSCYTPTRGMAGGHYSEPDISIGGYQTDPAEPADPAREIPAPPEPTVPEPPHQQGTLIDFHDAAATVRRGKRF